jgi:hypothetical protein
MGHSPDSPGLDDVVRRARETHARAEELLVRTRSLGQALAARVGRLLGEEIDVSEQMLSEQAGLSLERRKEIFAALVEVQDRRMGVAESRLTVANRFGVSVQEIRQIESEAVEQNWPPLDDAG